jgi:predicted Fe-S protein YdhL (DUF1289 family)
MKGTEGKPDEAIEDVPSPCVRNCCLDDKNICLGCLRSLTEICAWHEAPDAEKIEILVNCRRRYRERYLTRP